MIWVHTKKEKREKENPNQYISVRFSQKAGPFVAWNEFPRSSRVCLCNTEKEETFLFWRIPFPVEGDQIPKIFNQEENKRKLELFPSYFSLHSAKHIVFERSRKTGPSSAEIILHKRNPKILFL